MKFISRIKNNYLALSKNARVIYTIAVIAFTYMTFKFVSAYITPAPVEKRKELDGRVSADAEVQILRGQETKNLAEDQTDPLLDIAKQVDTEKSKDDFNKTGIGTENIQLAAWADESKTMFNNKNEQNDSNTASGSPYILRDPTSSRLPEHLSGQAFALKYSPPAKTPGTPADYKKDFANLDPESAKKVISSMVNDLEDGGKDWKPPVSSAQTYIQGDAEQYNWEVNKIRPASIEQAEYQQKINSYIVAQQAVASPQKQGQQAGNNQDAKNTGNQSANNANQTSGSTQAGTVADASLGRGLLPGDILPCTLIFAINSDLSSVSACEVVRGPLKGAIIGLSVQREEEYVTLTSTGITFNDYYETLSGIAISMEAYGTTGIRSDIDRHTLSRWSSLLFAGAFDGVWELYRQPRQQTIVTDSGIVQTTQEPTDRQVLLAALSRPASILTQSAAKNFEKPNTIYVHRGELVGIYIQQPFNKEWLPDVSKNANKIDY